MDLGDMNLSYINIVVENETVSEVIYRRSGGQGEKEREREKVAQNLRSLYTVKNRIKNRNKTDTKYDMEYQGGKTLKECDTLK